MTGGAQVEGFRHENKYIISQAGYGILRSRLASMMELDANQISQTGEYFIRSLYFDDSRQRALVDKLDGIENREKFRIRFYNMNSTFIRLESKQKWSDLVRKESAVLTRDETEAILKGDMWQLYYSQSELIRNFYLKYQNRCLRPAILVDYVREAYLFRDVRITFDKNLHTGNYGYKMFDRDLLTLPVLPDNQMILEVKYNHMLPESVFRLLQGVPAVRSAISKYVLCRKYQ